MKKSLLLLFTSVIMGCGWLPTNTGNSMSQSDDTEVIGPVDTELHPDGDDVTECERACAGFEFTTCMSVLMKALPVGVGIHSSDCIDRCGELVVVYSDMPPGEQLDFGCLETAATCPAVAGCFGITE